MTKSSNLAPAAGLFLMLLTYKVQVSAFTSPQPRVTFLSGARTTPWQTPSTTTATTHFHHFHHVEGEMHPESDETNAHPSSDAAADTTAPSSEAAEPSSLKELLLAREVIQQQMYQLKSKYPTAEADFLAAARARAAQKVESINSQARDEDWERVAKVRKETLGEVDDWEASLGNGVTDSQILLMADPSNNDDEDNQPEPKLLLF